MSLDLTRQPCKTLKAVVHYNVSKFITMDSKTKAQVAIQASLFEQKPPPPLTGMDLEWLSERPTFLHVQLLVHRVTDAWRNYEAEKNTVKTAVLQRVNKIIPSDCPELHSRNVELSWCPNTVPFGLPFVLYSVNLMLPVNTDSMEMMARMLIDGC